MKVYELRTYSLHDQRERETERETHAAGAE